MKWWKENDTTAVIKFYGEIYRWWKNDAIDFTDTFDDLQRQFKTIKIRVHCYGGQVTEGNVIQHAITNATCEVIVVIEGVVASMGSLIILGANKITMAENGYFMIHEPKGFVEGNAKQLFEQANLLKKMTASAIKAYSTRSGKPASEFQKFMDGADHFLSADEAKALGLVDEIIPSVVSNVRDITKDKLEDPDMFKEAFDRYAASLSDSTTIPHPIQNSNHNHNQNSNEMKELLIATFGLTGVTKDSSDTAVLEAVKTKMTEQDAKLKSLEKSTITALIASTEQKHGVQFSAEQKASLTSIGEKSGIDQLQIVVALMAPAKAAKEESATTEVVAPTAQVISLINPESKNAEMAARSGWTYSQWMEKDSAGLMEMRTKDQKTYIKLYQAEYNIEPDLS
jgi:ATP-dependent protease ClpP protease subunit